MDRNGSSLLKVYTFFSGSWIPLLHTHFTLLLTLFCLWFLILGVSPSTQSFMILEGYLFQAILFQFITFCFSNVFLLFIISKTPLFSFFSFSFPHLLHGRHTFFTPTPLSFAFGHHYSHFKLKEWLVMKKKGLWFTNTCQGYMVVEEKIRAQRGLRN